MAQTNDEQTPNYVGRVVHVRTEGGCREATITDLNPRNTSFVHVDDEERPRIFDRARALSAHTWHYADHGLWRDPNWDR